MAIQQDFQTIREQRPGAGGSQPTIFALHTSFALVDLLKTYFEHELPGVKIVNIVDDSLLADVRAAGHLTPSVTRRLLGYAQLAQSAGADAIFNCCSSVGDAADLIRKTVDIPVIKIDDKMAELAVASGSRIAVVATVPTTLDPTIRLIETKACEANKSITVTPHLVDGAFDALIGGDVERHDRMVMSGISRASEAADIVVLAQASMSRLISRLGEKTPVPVLSSPQSGVEELGRVLQEQTGYRRSPKFTRSAGAVNGK